MNAEKWTKINEIFHAALEIEAEKRLRFIKEKCGDDAEMFVEISKLICAHENSENFIENHVANNALEILSNENKENDLNKSPDFTDFQKIARFGIVKMLGKGGMGEVFLAQDESLERDVAIKILPADFISDLSRISRFVREAKVASALNHPNILTIYEVGEFEKTHFIASEYVNGKTLSTYLDQQTATLSDILKLAVQIVSALKAAHEAGIVHRDIKPDNIMVRNDGIVKVLDFGLAKLLENRNLKSGQTTAVGIIMGTPNYMSPEQARGKEIDYQTDIFSFGVVLYEMLSGKLPFQGESINDTIAAILTKEPKTLENIPSKLTEIVEKCLQKDKQVRYLTAKSLLWDLEEFKDDLQLQDRLEKSVSPNLNGQKTQILSVTTTDNFKQKITAENVKSDLVSLKRKGFAVVVFIFFIVAGFFGYQYFSPSKQIKSVAVLPFINESGNAEVEYLSDGMTDTLIRGLSQLPNLDVKARSSVFRYKGREFDLKQIGDELNAQAVLVGRFIQQNDRIILDLELVEPQTGNVIWKENYDRKQSDLVSLQSDVARDVSTNLKNKISGEEETRMTDNGTTNSEAYQAYLKGRYFLTKGNYDAPQSAIKYFQEAVALDPSFALGYSGLADCYTLLGTVMMAKFTVSETIPPAKKAAEKAIELDPNLSEAYVSLAWIQFRHDWDWAEAEKNFKKAIELNPKNAQAYQWFGEFLGTLRRDEEAISNVKKARDLEPFNLLLRWNYAKVFLDVGRYDEAIAEAKKLYELDKTFVRTYRILRQSYSAKGMYAVAFEFFIKDRELQKEKPERLELYKKIYQTEGYKAAEKKWLENVLLETENMNAGYKAVVYSGLKDKEKTLYWLEEAYKEKISGVILLKLPNYDFVRNELRFQELYRKINFPQN